MVFVETFFLLTILGFLLYKWLRRNFQTFTQRGIPHEKPKLILGNVPLRTLLGQGSPLGIAIEQYSKNKHHKVYGSYAFSDALFIVHDLEIIKKIGIKDFDHFVNHQMVSLGDKDKVFGRMLTTLKDQQWKEMRNTLTPSFTGNKLRLMHELINECSIEDVQYIEEQIRNSQNHEIELEMKDYFSRFANDVIATVAFGIKVNSFKDKDNKFYKTGNKMTQFEGASLVKAILYTIMPKVMMALGISLTDQQMMKYFHELVFGAIKYRQEHHITRPDMIQQLLEAKSSFDEAKDPRNSTTHATFEDDDLLAQCLLFFIAGLEPVSRCLCFTMYELAMNVDIQEQLYREIMQTEEQLNGAKLNYDVLIKMDYLNMVICESLRKWPPAQMTDRVASNDYKVIDENDNLIVELKKGDRIVIPIFCIQHDNEYYPQPEKFDPERFSKENEHLLKPNSYLPFGIGPRNCIGNRLALMEMKSIIYNLIKQFKFAPTNSTPADMIAAIKGFQTMPKEKFPMKIKRRTIN